MLGDRRAELVKGSGLSQQILNESILVFPRTRINAYTIFFFSLDTHCSSRIQVEEGLRNLVGRSIKGIHWKLWLQIYHVCFKHFQGDFGGIVEIIGGIGEAPSICLCTKMISTYQFSFIFFPFHEISLALLEDSSYALHIFNNKGLFPLHMSLQMLSTTLHNLQQRGIKSFVLSI